MLPQDEYFRLVRGDDKSIPKRLLKSFSDIPVDAGGDMFVQAGRFIQANAETLGLDPNDFFVYVRWLQERFPAAAYEDVTGLCKLATLVEVKEQDYSLNSGRYVGVVIEEDGKAAEEFLAEILAMNEELEMLNKEAHVLEGAIAHNIKALVGDE